jgi:hypothetical protein
MCTVSHVLIPTLYACSSSGRASSSFRTQSCHAGSPYDMAPRMTFETFRPDFPRLYGHDVSVSNSRWRKDQLLEWTHLTYSILANLIGMWSQELWLGQGEFEK